jgi:DNA-nicking Smr family endonuclease
MQMSRKSKDGDGFNRPFAGLKLPSKPTPVVEKPTPPPVRVQPPPAVDDEELFLREVGRIAPLPPKGGRVGAPPPADPTKRRAPASDDAEVLAELADLCDGVGAFDITDSDEYIEGLGPGVDRRLLKRLRAGEFAIQAHVDLHGLTRELARDRVARFIAESTRAGRRCVLIVHGRGQHSKDQIPVLKTAVRGWLERGAIARAVLAFATARPHDGGAGAVYVLLRTRHARPKEEL